ncbi:hypothetical protein CO2235_U590031 [Cupriavidus oxalaticus]|uniref:Uncharacterized protein n=1 Tax=Cupriavidus oxalaticus TaxID=96344 RepID=A0A375FRL9_9BURK|nr:hypothetical protein CO2235_U590031 [Cupriavidus oxalaticus]
MFQSHPASGEERTPAGAGSCRPYETIIVVGLEQDANALAAFRFMHAEFGAGSLSRHV